MERNKALAAKRANRDDVQGKPLSEVLQKPKGEYPNRMPLLLSDEQFDRIRRLAYEKNLRNVEVVRRMIDSCSDDVV